MTNGDNMRDRHDYVDDRQGLQPTPPAIPRDKGRASSSSPRMADRFTTMEKHRPIWARGLTATELDKRQEQARVMNHGHQVLLESKLGKLDLREKRSVKDIRRKTENMLELLQNIQSSTPRLGSLERPGSSTSGGPGALAQSPADRRRLAPHDQQHLHTWEESSSCGESPESEKDSMTSLMTSSTQNFHLPRLHANPTTPKFNTRRRYSANDALAQSIERFHTYKANLGRFPSTEAIEENDEAFQLPRNTPRSSFRNSRQKLHVDDNGVSYEESRSVSSSQSDTDMTEPTGQSDDRSSHVSFKAQSGQSPPKQTTVPEGIRKPAYEQTSPNDEIDAINSANKNASKPSTAPSISRSLSVLAPEFLPIIRAQSRDGKRPNKEEVDHDDDNDNEENHVEGDVSIIVPFHHKTDRSLRMTRRQSLAVKPATFRNLDNRRKSSPDVLTSTITLNQRVLLRSRQMSTTILPSSPRSNRSSDVDLHLKIKNFLDRTDTFIQSGERSPREEEELL